MPSADFCKTAGNLSVSLVFDETLCRPPRVRLTTFSAPPLDLLDCLLMDMDFVVSGPLVQTALPDIQFLFVGPRIC